MEVLGIWKKNGEQSKGSKKAKMLNFFKAFSTLIHMRREYD